MYDKLITKIEPNLDDKNSTNNKGPRSRRAGSLRKKKRKKNYTIFVQESLLGPSLT